MQVELKKLMADGKIDFFLDDDKLYKFTNFLDKKRIEYGETSITPNKVVVYLTDVFDSGLRYVSKERNIITKSIIDKSNSSNSSMIELDSLIEEKIKEQLDCVTLDRVCSMLKTSYGKEKIMKSVRALILNQGMRDIDACLAHIENQLEGIN